MQYNQSEFLFETIVPKNELIVSRTDLKGIITYANETFAEISNYEVDELIGKPHNIVRHPDMPKAVFDNLWKSLKNDGKWSGFVKNLRKDFGFYWVFAEISGVYKEGKLVEYKSIRTPISFENKLFYQNKYDEMKKKNGDFVRTISYELYDN
ncbi:MAG: chemotaxis protein [Arcobacter sp.]|nr:MAG: chemotaxis protein [Arcobacter sp.]